MEWLPEGHLAFFILDVVEELDLDDFKARIREKDARGNRPYEPKMMVALLLYGYCTGVFSSRKLESATWNDVAFRVLAGGHQPHFTTINSFRKEYRKELRSLFLQVLKLCQSAGLVKLGHVALDGTKMKANASKRKAMSYQRMLKSELELNKEIDDLLKKADKLDSKEDKRFGKGQKDEDLPTELQHREKRRDTIRKAKERLEKEASLARARELREQAARKQEKAEASLNESQSKRSKAAAQKALKQAKELDPDAKDDDFTPPKTGSGLPLHEPKSTSAGQPDAKAQMNFTDPDSRIMPGDGGFIQGYNCQAAVDEEHQIIVAQALSNHCSDRAALTPLLEQIHRNCTDMPSKVTADAGYWRPDAESRAKQLGADVYISTARRETSENQAQTSSEALQKMRAKLSSKKGRALYARRKAVVEPVFGQIKEARGFRRFLLRGLDKVESEWALVCTGHNLLKLWRAHLA